MSQAGANQVVVVGRDGLQHVQHGDGILQHVIAAPQEPGGVEEVAVGDQARARSSSQATPFSSSSDAWCTTWKVISSGCRNSSGGFCSASSSSVRR